MSVLDEDFFSKNSLHLWGVVPPGPSLTKVLQTESKKGVCVVRRVPSLYSIRMYESR